MQANTPGTAPLTNAQLKECLTTHAIIIANAQLALGIKLLTSLHKNVLMDKYKQLHAMCQNRSVLEANPIQATPVPTTPTLAKHQNPTTTMTWMARMKPKHDALKLKKPFYCNNVLLVHHLWKAIQ